METFFTQVHVLDVVFGLLFVFYAVEGYQEGTLHASVSFLGFLLSFFLGLVFYGVLGRFLFGVFPLSQGFANGMSLFLIVVGSEVLFLSVFKKIITVVFTLQERHWSSFFNNIGGVGFCLASAYILLAFFVNLMIALPVSLVVKNAVSESRLGTVLSIHVYGFEKRLGSIFGEAALNGLAFYTIAPESTETMQLKQAPSKMSVDEKAEQEMVSMINGERSKHGLDPLVVDAVLSGIARNHAEDMFKRGYFSHYTPEGFSPFDRMGIANIRYKHAGENLALAPTVTLAMEGFMQNEKHRATILSSDFVKVGIGVINGGIYGKMFLQEFTD